MQFQLDVKHRESDIYTERGKGYLKLKRGQVEEFGRLALCAGCLPDRNSAIHRRCVQVLRINGIGQTE
jgi:hypothetical protein